MAEVDHEDDTKWRWVLHHYRFDPVRRERRNVVVAAYDNENQFDDEFESYGETIRAEIAAGARSPEEHISGGTWEPGHLAAAKRGHDVRRAIEHGVSPVRLLDGQELPQNMGMLTGWNEDPGSLVDGE
ncbi:MAG TPA: hypothetical protein VGM38_03595 [Pseudolysinimonas sp.]|jgi:hypothetical protein